MTRRQERAGGKQRPDERMGGGSREASASAPEGCGALGPRLTAYLVGEISPAGRAWVEAHLAGCAPCRAERDAVAAVLAACVAAFGDLGGEEPGSDVADETPVGRAGIAGAVAAMTIGVGGAADEATADEATAGTAAPAHVDGGGPALALDADRLARVVGARRAASGFGRAARWAGGLLAAGLLVGVSSFWVIDMGGRGGAPDGAIGLRTRMPPTGAIGAMKSQVAPLGGGGVLGKARRLLDDTFGGPEKEEAATTADMPATVVLRERALAPARPAPPPPPASRPAAPFSPPADGDAWASGSVESRNRESLDLTLALGGDKRKDALVEYQVGALGLVEGPDRAAPQGGERIAGRLEEAEASKQRGRAAELGDGEPASEMAIERGLRIAAPAADPAAREGKKSAEDGNERLADKNAQDERAAPDASTLAAPLLGAARGPTGAPTSASVPRLPAGVPIQGGLLDDVTAGGRQGDPTALLAAARGRERALRAQAFFGADGAVAVTDREAALRALAALSVPSPARGDEGLGQEGFRQRYGVNPFVDTERDRFSTFAMDVDTASYARARSLLRSGRLPDPEAVRVEEFVNAVPAAYEADRDRAFSVYCEGAPSPFGAGAELVQVVVKARELAPGERRPAVLTVAVDVSGSMAMTGRLDLVRDALRRLFASLAPDDRVALVAYAGEAYLVLPHTPARERQRLFAALDALAPKGGTHLEAGLELAYRLADEAHHPRGLSRVLLFTDGVATEGARGAEALVEKARLFAGRGIYLSVLGVGQGALYDDALLERISNEANGGYAFLDSLAEAERVLVRELPQTIDVLARDAKIQVEWDPQAVTAYRLLGYENRDIADADFRRDDVDAGEVGPGSTVTALFEVERRPGARTSLGRVMVRYHLAATGLVEELEFPIVPGAMHARLVDASPRLGLTACAAELAELLRRSYWAQDGSFADLLAVLWSLPPEARVDAHWYELWELAARAHGVACAHPATLPRAAASR